MRTESRQPSRPSVRRDDAVDNARVPAEIKSQDAARQADIPPVWARIERVWWMGLVGAMLVFSAFPIANLFLGLSTKDYGLWYQVGLAVRQGLDIYPRPETTGSFRSCTLQPPRRCLPGSACWDRSGRSWRFVLVNSAAWVVCIWLVGLAGGGVSSAATSAGRDRSVPLHRSC